MEKKGQVEFFAVVAFLVVTGGLIAGTYFITVPTSSSHYVGDITTNKFYDYKCTSKIDKTNRVFFESYKSALDLKFEYSKICP